MEQVRVFDERRCRLGEGPHYDERTGDVTWVDILGSRILRRGVRSGAVDETSLPAHVGAAVPRRGGGLVLCLPDGPVLADPHGTLRPLGGYAAADAAAGQARPDDGPQLRSNDAKADPAGRLWLGTMAYDESRGAGALYRLDPGASGPIRVLGGITVSNGLGWSPDGRTMYHIDSPTRRIDAYGYEPGTGELGERRVFAEIDTGFPDGMCVDAEGGVWVALWQGAAVRRYLPDGRLDRVVRVPTPQVTSCAFAGDAYQLLIITTAAAGRPADEELAGVTFVHKPGDAAGRPVDRYGG